MKNAPEWKSVEAKNKTTEPPTVAPDSTTAGWLNKRPPGLRRGSESSDGETRSASAADLSQD